MIIYGYTKCSTVQKTLKFFDENNLDYDFIDFVANKIDEKTLIDLIKRSNLNIDDFFNKRGILYRENNLKDKLVNLSEKEKISYLLSDGRMIKRPVIDFGDKIFVGFKEKEILEYISKKL
ncbi:arsenate reductase [Bacilli bacterium PM5-9]|nr:arsenate reductase [Bacilli bacterium PM5-9]